MARVEEYAQYIKELLTHYAQYKPAYGEVEVQTIFDDFNHHYQVCSVGWDGDERIRGCVLHIDIKGNKIWIQHDGTEVGIANELLELGVPRQDIILAFHAPYKREYTGFAVS